MAWPKGVPRKPVTIPSETTEPMSSPSRIFFNSVWLLSEVDRLDGSVGLAASNTKYFRHEAGYTIELDTLTGLVIIRGAKGGSIEVPRERVERFGMRLSPEAK